MAKKNEILAPRTEQLLKNINAKAERARLSWLDDRLERLPKNWRAGVLRRYDNLRKKGREKSGNIFVRKVTDINPMIDIAASDAEIVSESKVCASKARAIIDSDKAGAMLKLVHFFGQYDVRLPVEHDREGIFARARCAKFWLRQLRASHARACESACIDAGLVHKFANIYVSDDTLTRRSEQKRRNAEALESVKIQNEDGEKITLAQAAAAGVANPENRASELITRVKGFEDYARENVHQCVFITITTPSRFHAVLSGGRVNPKYKGEKPNEAQSYLTGQWARARALFAKHGVKFYGLRVVEPHHDGTPHWHAAIWLENAMQLPVFKDILEACFLRAEICDGDEDGAAANRLKFDLLDNGSVVGYMLKYICKNLAGVNLKGEDHEAVNSDDNAARVEAWASTWRIRQFQQLGGHSVTVWRELRRVEESQLEALQVSTPIMQAWRAVHRVGEKMADWCKYLKAQGGHSLTAREAYIKLAADLVVKNGVYGEAIVYDVFGVRERYGDLILKNNRKKWARVGAK